MVPAVRWAWGCRARLTDRLVCSVYTVYDIDSYRGWMHATYFTSTLHSLHIIYAYLCVSYIPLIFSAYPLYAMLGQGQDHRRGRVHRGARERRGQVPA